MAAAAVSKMFGVTVVAKSRATLIIISIILVLKIKKGTENLQN